MPSVTRGTITVDLPETWRLEPRRRRPALAPEGELSSFQIAQAFGEHFTEVEVLPLAPADEKTAGPPRRRGPAAAARGAEQASFDVGVAADENAVLLVVQDGVYTWVHGVLGESTRKVRGGPGRKVSFTLELQPTATVRRSRTRGFKPSILLKPLKVIVFKFLAGVAVGQLVKRFERDVETGLVWIRSSDPESSWTSLAAGDKGPTLPQGRQARVLLLVHGTFSSTQGGYGHLKASPTGRQFLDRALKHYDAVIGFDHRTLSEDPKENADQLKEALTSLDRGDGIVIDAVTHSRGALVLRSLVEHLLDPSGPIRVNRAVMVAGPNAGTRLAAPDRWSDLVDLYTNLVVGGSNLVRSILPQSALATTILSESIKGIAALVKAITTAAVDASMAPGLAAMDPAGAFIAQINQRQPGQPTPDQIWYAAVTTNYEPQVIGGPGSLPTRLGFAIGDAAIDQLMGARNDLVVDVPSMTSVDLPLHYFKDVFDVPEGPATYHTTYFNQPSVIHRIGAWLSIDTIPGDPDTGPSGGSVTALPAGGTGRIAVVDEDVSRDVADGLVKADDSDFAVVRRRTRGGALEHLAIDRDDFDKMISRMGSGDVLSQALGPRRNSSLEVAIGASHDAIRHLPVRATGGSTVLMRGHRPVGVLPSPRPGRTHAKPRRGTPKSSTGAAARTSPKPVDGEARIGALMPDRIDVEDHELVLVELSVDALQTAIGAGSVNEVFRPSSEKPITVHAIGTSNASILGEDQAEVEAPRPGSPRLLQFSVRGDRVGPGQVVVVAGQGAVVLVRLVLDFEVVQPRDATAPSRVGAASISVSRVVERSEPAAPCDKIWIEETKSVGEVTVDGGAQFVTFETAFDVRYLSESEDIQERGVTKPIKGDRVAYVVELYKKIEADWGASQGDAAAFHDALKSYGGQLFDELVPEPIQKVLWDNKDRIKTVQVTSDDPYIPWELVHLKGPDGRLPKEDRFLAEMGLVRWLDGAGAPPRSFSLRKRARYVLAPEYPVGSGWELDTAKESALLKERYGARSVDATWQGLRTLIEKPGQFDLLHFAGHGAAPAGNIERAALVLDVREDDTGTWEPWTVDATMVEQFTNLAAPSGGRPLVFLNACQVGRAGYQLTSVGGFAQAFLRGGAGAFVSCLWQVGDEPAIAFCRTFYGALARGKTIARATAEARRRARADGDPTWLAYVVYGRPEATVTFR